LLGAGAIDQQTCTRAVEGANDRALRSSHAWTDGATRLLKDYVAESRDAAAATEQAFANAFSGAADTLVGFIRSGKLKFHGLADSILADLARMTVRQTITAPLAGALQRPITVVVNVTAADANSSGRARARSRPTWRARSIGRAGTYEPRVSSAARSRWRSLAPWSCLLCNDAELFQRDGVWTVEGDPTEGSLYPFATKLGMDRKAAQSLHPRINAIPFESEHRFMATLHEDAGGEKMLPVKGAPEVILEHCDRQQPRDGQPAPIDRAHFEQAGDRLAAKGERVLALAWQQDPAVTAEALNPADLPKNLVLLGLIGLLDPPRKEAIGAVRECHGGGIRITMITGDHKITAAAIARMLGIGDARPPSPVLRSRRWTPPSSRNGVQDVDVFARASPEHKLRLVKAIQANRQIVAMTGDGVNDAPSLKKADIGVAMGIKGTEVTRRRPR
jgi:magnesium-transporting ATPase (P-type)